MKKFSFILFIAFLIFSALGALVIIVHLITFISGNVELIAIVKDRTLRVVLGEILFIALAVFNYKQYIKVKRMATADEDFKM